METLTFKAVKAIIDNLEFAQTVELSQLLNEKVTQMKLVTIKQALVEKFQIDEYLRQFLPLIAKIDKISVSDHKLIMEFQDEPRYQLILTFDDDDNEGVEVKVYGDIKIGFNRTERGWRYIGRYEDAATRAYLTNFGNIFLDSFSLETEEAEEYPLWGSSIKDFLSPDESTLEL
ncbi:MAG: hypothetical protein H0U27_07230 [Nitrosopumilus sp.]|nr:hypothetical protein [Nitrosopumilus sp.]